MGRGPSNALMTHVHWEIMHAQWAILLDDKFLEIYAHGIVLEGENGINRRFYPRIFAYSADYPEKSVTLYLHLLASLTLPFARVLLATIHSKGRCPCPHCLMPLNKIHSLGRSILSSRWQRSNGGKYAFVVFELNSVCPLKSKTLTPLAKRWSATTILVSQRTHMNTLELFWGTTLGIPP